MNGGAVSSANSRSEIKQSWVWLGVILLVVGLSGHLLAARAIGGYYIAYRDHIAGFVFLTVVSGAILAALGWRFWKGRHDITLLSVGAVQAILGALIYLNHSPRLQSELQVTMESPGDEGQNHNHLRFRGYVVRLEPGPEKDQTAVGIVFTE